MGKTETDKIKKETGNKEIQVPLERMGQQPGQFERDFTRSILDDPASKLKILNEKMSGVSGFDTPHLSKHNKVKTFMVSMFPVALQQGVEELFASRFPEHRENTGGVVHYNGHTFADNVFYSQLKQLRNQDKYADILITTDMNCLFDYRKRFINKQNFESFNTQYNSIFSGTGLDHPQKIFRFLGADALVMVVDKSIYNAQAPREWYELLHPKLQNSLVLCGETDYGNYSLYLHYVRDFGLEAVRQLHRNTLDRMHPEEMLHAINNHNSLGASIYVMPYSYARQFENRTDYELVWPNDGAIVVPIQMLVKKNATEKYRDIIRYMCGTEIGCYLRDMGFISANPRVEQHTAGHSLNWLGWEFIRNSPMEEIKNEIRMILTSDQIG